ncbi:ABC transporter permease [Streptomyces sp. NBC_01497]|uniref:ABC transporter permease n=1 Tax=Streptomyces sp. NBC_01497 TaxID=2903885 RepID=UPI002E350939|nr:ABC transporter permease [Streptomyces sp. NBC_01497]
MSTATSEEPETQSAHRHRAHAMDSATTVRGAAGMKGVLLPVLIVLGIGSIFVSVYLAAFHAPAPHHLPVAVVGDERTLAGVERGLEHGQPGGFTVRGYASESEARTALHDRQVYAAYIAPGAGSASSAAGSGPSGAKAGTSANTSATTTVAAVANPAPSAGRSATGGPGTAPELLYAGANGSGVTATVTGAFGAVATAQGQQLTAHDVVPASTGDSRGLSVFYAAFGVVLAGFLYGTMTYQLAPRLEYRLRMLSLGLFGALGGLVVSLIGGHAFGAVPGPFLEVAVVVALMATAAGGATMALMRLFGPAGVMLSTIMLLIFGNATCGGVLPAPYLPDWLHPLHAILPVGAGVRAIQGVSYFRSDGLATGLIVLGLWTLVCTGVLYVRDVWSVRLLARTP